MAFKIDFQCNLRWLHKVVVKLTMIYRDQTSSAKNVGVEYSTFSQSNQTFQEKTAGICSISSLYWVL